MSILTRVSRAVSLVPKSRIHLHFSSSSPSGIIPVVNSSLLHSHLKDDSNDSDFVTVDVRPMEEIRATFGRAIDEYLDPKELGSEEDFEEEFNFPHPLHDNNKTIMFICRGGVRSKLACEIARQQGVSNVANYLEGAAGWDSWWTAAS
ncbi:hypothetical protein TrRE_jg6795 [Triparma retinervis]|uniref:Rhodanese domain-containing protein n=1 Tax=Triparma retinervis TaxID=2557542 RepID=A0A9W7AQA3_9STRA|nr:hypothetical protein TrRE_jg6795 [Triparma retinervis]